MNEQAPRPPHELAVMAFEEADAKYQAFEEWFLRGGFIVESFIGRDVDSATREFQDLVQELKELLDDRNTKLKTAKDEMRAKVALSHTQERGPEDPPEKLEFGKLSVSSVTNRSFDPQSLFNLCKKHGIYERLLELRATDKDGQQKRLVQEYFDIDFAGVYSWLKSNKLIDVINGSYQAAESTPQVKGPKALAFIGDNKAEK